MFCYKPFLAAVKQLGGDGKQEELTWFVTMILLQEELTLVAVNNNTKINL